MTPSCFCRSAALLLTVGALAGCFRTVDQPGAAVIAIGPSPTADARSAQPRARVVEGATSLVDYDLRQQVDLTPDSIGQYYQRFIDAAEVLGRFGWMGGFARTWVRKTGPEVPPTVTVQVDRFATADSATDYLDSLRRQSSPSLSHFLDLAGPPAPVNQPVAGDDAVAFEAGLADRGITPQIVRVRYYAFRRGPWIGQVVVIRDGGPPWPEIVAIARAQDDRLRAP